MAPPARAGAHDAMSNQMNEGEGVGYLQCLAPGLPPHPFVPLYVGFASSLFRRLTRSGHETINKKINGRTGVLFYAYRVECAAEAAYTEVACIQYLNPVLNKQLSRGAPKTFMPTLFADSKCASGPAYYSGRHGFHFPLWANMFNSLALDAPGVYFVWQALPDFAGAAEGRGEQSELERIRVAASRETEAVYGDFDLAALYKPAAALHIRARELHDAGLSHEEISGRLSLEGYQGMRGNNRWSNKAIRNLLEKTTETLQSAQEQRS